MIPSWTVLAICLTFIFGYGLIVLEHFLRINKAAGALLMATACWLFFFLNEPAGVQESFAILSHHFSSVAQIVFFLLGAMTIVELIDSHQGFKIITDRIHLSSKRGLLWVTSFVAFFLSSVLDNLTSTIVMISLLRKLIPNKEEQILFGAMMVIATNAGGAWTPIGDVTTTMLWIGGQITSIGIMKSLFLPSLACLVVPLAVQSIFLKGSYRGQSVAAHPSEPQANLIFWMGIGSLILVPVLKAFTGMPPFMGILLGVAIMWLTTDLLHEKHEDREHLRVPHILTKVDVSGVLFFLGILLAVSSLAAIGVLKDLATWLGAHLSSESLVAFFIGLASAVIDNVPLVAATMGMYDLSLHPVDTPLWKMIAFAAGTGGSILIIGSAAGVAFMGLSRVDFAWYVKRISLLALLGYLSGFGLYLLIG